MDLREAVKGVAGFASWNHADRIRYLAWFQHAGLSKEHWEASDITAAYELLNIDPPKGGVHAHLRSLDKQRHVLKSGNGYRLEAKWRAKFETRYGSRAITVQVHELLASLPGKLSTDAQRDYLDEALRCFRAEAWRAAAIMSWNLTFDHLCHVILTRALPEFSAEYGRVHAKKPIAFAKRSDLQELKESEVIRIARTIKVTDGNQHNCLERNLGVRNEIAHPSGVLFGQPSSEAFILAVIQNVVLSLNP